MSVPDFQSMMRPLLELLADGDTHTHRELKEKLAGKMSLTAAELQDQTGRST